MTREQRNDMCASCHARMVPLSTSFQPGDRFFDHFDLGALEDPDFHADGRELGETYTFTTWRLSRCAQAGALDCVTCHTSSGRYRFRQPEDANRACLPCHARQVERGSGHTHHAAGSIGSRCVSCHMPATEFARMRRSDHSMRPPAPAATLEFGSPNACNLCHADRDARWTARACELRPESSRYAYALGFALGQAGDEKGAIAALEAHLRRTPADPAPYELLAAIHLDGGRASKAMGVYRRGVRNRAMGERDRAALERRIEEIAGR
jgi:hypothetical protein